MPSPQEPFAEMKTNEAHSAGDENVHRGKITARSMSVESGMACE